MISGVDQGGGGTNTSTTTATNSDNLNEETVLEPTSDGSVSGGSSSNTLSATGDITVNEESPQALTELGQALSQAGAATDLALEEEYDTTKEYGSLVGQNTQTPTQQIIPIIIALALLAGAYVYFNRRG